MSILRWNPSAITIAGSTGQKGNASNLLNVPFGLTLDSSTTLYIADGFNNRVQKYLRDESFGVTVAGQVDGSSNSTSSYLNFPSDVAVDSDGNIYVTDTFNYRVQLWTSGSSSGTLAAGTGISGSTNDTLSIVYGIARDSSSGTLYISDTGNHRIMRYLSGASSGTVIAGGNGAGLSITQLSNPIGLCFDSSTNSLLIANYGANNIVRWIIGSQNWTLVAGNINGLSGSTSNKLNQPTDVTIDPMGNIYVVDMGNNRVQFFSYDQSNGTTIAGVTNSNGNTSILLNNPYSITLDNQLNLYDEGNINVPGTEILTPAMLRDVTLTEQKQLLGERLFVLVQQIEPTLAAKITGMFIELDIKYILTLIKSQNILKEKIKEAIDILKTYQYKQHYMTKS
ncbi:unnamed protein product [Rotaria sp. Silwood1]|nr:unnamed protein product [Rotaria sp. Silwood1]